MTIFCEWSMTLILLGPRESALQYTSMLKGRDNRFGSFFFATQFVLCHGRF